MKISPGNNLILFSDNELRRLEPSGYIIKPLISSIINNINNFINI